jgi:cell pole-organizing protein PopZ
MTKPQFSAEPSMEDILASIRKMISEERLGPRPIPDQIGRSPFGESVAETPAPGPGHLEPRSEPMPAPAERPAPSFSSLSDALKAAAPASEQRRTLEEKIADMLEDGDSAPVPASPADTLAVFAATRISSATSPAPGAFTPAPRAPASERSAPERTGARQAQGSEEARRARAPRPTSRPPEAPLNGAAHRRDDRRDEPAAQPRPASATPKVVGTASAAESKKAETQRIIAMPPRHGAGSGAGQQAAESPAGPALNGGNVSSLGLRPFPGAQGARPTSALRDADKSPDAGADNAVTARSPDAVSKPSGGLGPKSSSEGAVRNKADDALSDEPAKVTRDPRKARDEGARKSPPAEMPRPVDTVAPAARTSVDVAKKAEAPSEGRAAKTASAPAAAKPAVGGGPSDALVDAVVALVHKEPDTLSVFTSGSAFIHGVTHDDPVAYKPGPNMTRKLDRSAAELLRPMLRQWLSDNMPRIVEEALRSELMNAQSEPKDSDEG